MLKVTGGDKFENCIFALHFLNIDISLNIVCPRFRFEGGILHELMGRTASEILYLGRSFGFENNV